MLRSYLLNSVAMQIVYVPDRDKIILVANIKHSSRRLYKKYL